MYYIIGYLVGPLVAILYIIIIWWSDKSKTEPIKIVKPTELGILGWQGAGKTTLYERLNKKYKGQETTYKDKVPSFTIQLDENKSLTIADGVDIGGSKELRTENFDKFLSEKDIIIYIFDAYKYLNDKDHEKNVNSDFDALHEANIKRTDLEVRVIPSHAEKFNKKKYLKAYSLLKSKIMTKDYRDIVLKDSIPIIDISDNMQVDHILNKLFKI